MCQLGLRHNWVAAQIHLWLAGKFNFHRLSSRGGIRTNPSADKPSSAPPFPQFVVFPSHYYNNAPSLPEMRGNIALHSAFPCLPLTILQPFPAESRSPEADSISCHVRLCYCAGHNDVGQQAPASGLSRLAAPSMRPFFGFPPSLTIPQQVPSTVGWLTVPLSASNWAKHKRGRRAIELPLTFPLLSYINLPRFYSSNQFNQTSLPSVEMRRPLANVEMSSPVINQQHHKSPVIASLLGRFLSRQEEEKAPETVPMTTILRCLLFSLLLLATTFPLAKAQSFRRAVCPGGFPADSNDLCRFWAAIGECSRNPRFMQFQCAASCNNCQAQQSVRQAPVPVPTPSQAVQTVQPSAVQQSSAVDCSLRIQTVEIATRVVPTRAQFDDRAFSIGCAGINQANICSQNVCYHQRYRTLDGSCNNLGQSLRGAAYMPYARLQPANYEDGMARMVGNSKPMPNPRAVTHLLLSSSFVVLTKFNGLLMQFGQFLSHDITRNTITNFCQCQMTHEECANMPVPMHDTRLRKLTRQQPNFCIPMTRSGVLCGTGTGRTGPGRTPRTPMNENSAWIDASQVYGSDPSSARQLRVGALLRTLPLRNPPFSAVPPPDISSNSSNLLTGDTRGNLFVGLMALHTVFLRLHNIIATNFFRLNPHWDQERNYQETRRIIGAILQMITYQEFLPSLLGRRLSRHMPPYSGYKPDQEPAIAVEFAAGAYRLHGLIREFYQLADSNFRKIGDVRFVSNAGSVDLVMRTGTDQLIRGLMMIASKKPQRLAPAVTEELFDISDMGSLNIQRGRDQGLRPYIDYLQLCSPGRKLTSFQDWSEVNEPEAKNRVAALYASVNDVDLYVGGLLEAPVEDSLLGPTFSCIIAEQFRRLRDADRFFFQNPGVFTAPQLASIQRVTLASVICATGEDFRRINPSAFLVENGSTAVPCASIPQLDLSPWQERPAAQQG